MPFEGRLIVAVTLGVKRFPPDGVNVYTWMSTGPALAGATIRLTCIVGSWNAFEYGSDSALRAGCEFTSIDVMTSTAMPKIELAADRPAQPWTPGSAGAVRVPPDAVVSVATAALSDAGRRECTIWRLHAASAISATNTASLASRMSP